MQKLLQSTFFSSKNKHNKTKTKNKNKEKQVPHLKDIHAPHNVHPSTNDGVLEKTSNQNISSSSNPIEEEKNHTPLNQLHGHIQFDENVFSNEEVKNKVMNEDTHNKVEDTEYRPKRPSLREAFSSNSFISARSKNSSTKNNILTRRGRSEERVSFRDDKSINSATSRGRSRNKSIFSKSRSRSRSRSRSSFLSNQSTVPSISSDEEEDANETDSSTKLNSSGSLLDLKRFFNPAIPKTRKKSHKYKQEQQHSASFKESPLYELNEHLKNLLQPTSTTTKQFPRFTKNRIVIYHDLKYLEEKYGTFTKHLGTGANGTVIQLTNRSTLQHYALKTFKYRIENETKLEYQKRCISEFLISSHLIHPNVIQTYDLFVNNANSSSSSSKYELSQIMEYCPFDFFNVVMSDEHKMSRRELFCSFKQLALGVNYLHSLGISHRDLKLDNCVMNEHGILKIIDFGSATIFKTKTKKSHMYLPDEQHEEEGYEVILSQSIVGSDPYLAPEVFNSETPGYNASLVDVWSLGIIFYALMLKKFPWKIPQVDQDRNFEFYCREDLAEKHDYVESAKKHEELMKEKKILIKRQHQQSNTRSSSPIASQSQPLQEQLVRIKLRHSYSTNTTLPRKSTHNDCSKYGQYRVMRRLPHASRPIISRMLKVNPDERATISDLLHDKWFRNIPYCRSSLKDNSYIRASGHHHILPGPASSQGSSSDATEPVRDSS
ncbi:uncharacterized protein NDAI_0K01150 [Naumovozyma dairenensis CBS 421]|uniref:Protein kinase domain-containing protein n=1 Tax=Naumovozyma dairenensis (strain ATCC 10597 / BCRC 20456 / CBS 421 / NBRC 0211 / NRRL Y-12639) TaxID=1071378 RepID=G0WHP5_NAUDC|nr:hypothetical protein NDAI_0K01150 [Naumovozyma dairenensis CBS 421]CCD27306.1 hypothetical protein NDAI_0K01150 [Naumovozyma dairenensis CBS 421]